jgi:hypothetical protein
MPATAADAGEIVIALPVRASAIAEMTRTGAFGLRGFDG